MKILMWVGNEPNQRALANKIHEIWPLAGIVTESRVSRRKVTLSFLMSKIIERMIFPAIANSWTGMLSHYAKAYPQYPDVPRIDVTSINDPEVIRFTNTISPDLILVSGTGLIKEKLLSLQPVSGIMNLHTGLSPYVKGGPNCTHWCIATKQFHLIGNTIHWLDAGIDSGDLITTAHTAFTGDEDLLQIHLKVMNHAHALYLNAIRWLSEGHHHRIPQDQVGKGITYFGKQWDWKQRLALGKNLKKFKREINSAETIKKRASLTVVPLDSITK